MNKVKKICNEIETNSFIRAKFEAKTFLRPGQNMCPILRRGQPDGAISGQVLEYDLEYIANSRGEHSKMIYFIWVKIHRTCIKDICANC